MSSALSWNTYTNKVDKTLVSGSSLEDLLLTAQAGAGVNISLL